MRSALAIAALIVCSGTAAQERPLARFEANGAAAEVRAALDKVIQAQRRNDAPELAGDRADEERQLRRLQEDAVAALATEGFFTPRLDVRAEASGARYVVRIDLGPRARIGRVDVQLRGGIEQQPQRLVELVDEWGLPIGRPFRDAEWTAAKNRLLTRLLERDFAAARLVDSSATVDVEKGEVELRVVVDSGPPFTVGELQVSGLERYDRDLVERYNPFKPGDRYDAALLRDFQQRLQQSPYFGTSLVTIDPDPQRPDRVPLVVELREQRSKRIAVGAGYSTNTGPRVELTYRQAQILGYPYTLQTGAGLDETRFVTYADVLLPPKPNGALDSVGVLFERTDIRDVVTRRSAAGANRVYVRESDGVTYDTKLALNLQRERREFSDVLGEPQETNTTLALTYRWTRRAVDEVTDPRRGHILTLQGTVGVGQALLESASDNSFTALYARTVHYLPLPGLDRARNQLIARAELGRVFTDNPSVVPTDYLYRTGGAGSVRGYSYLSLGRVPGTTNAGGTILAVASLEAVRWFGESWGGAVFYDIGDAAVSTAALDWGRGSGVGVRWKTPAGPIAFDVAYGQKRADGSGGAWKLHFSVAIAL